MHEMPIVLNVVDFVDSYMENNSIATVDTVVMQIGEVANVMPDYFKKCWPSATERSRHMQNTKLEIETVPGIVKCTDCGAEYNLPANDGVCPNCRCRNWSLISGRELNIKELRVPS